MALDYLDYTHFSRSGLIDELVYQGFSVEDADRGPSPPADPAPSAPMEGATGHVWRPALECT